MPSLWIDFGGLTILFAFWAPFQTFRCRANLRLNTVFMVLSLPDEVQDGAVVNYRHTVEAKVTSWGLSWVLTWNLFFVPWGSRVDYMCMGPTGLVSFGILQVLQLISNQHYLHRMTVLVAIAALAPVVSHDVLCNTMLPVVIGCAKDKVSLVKGTALPCSWIIAYNGPISKSSVAADAAGKSGRLTLNYAVEGLDCRAGCWRGLCRHLVEKGFRTEAIRSSHMGVGRVAKQGLLVEVLYRMNVFLEITRITGEFNSL